MAREARAIRSAVSTEQDTWKPRFVLPSDSPYVVRAYAMMDTSHPDIIANVNALVHHESDVVMQDVENENDAETGNVVVTGYHHDRANETLLLDAREDGQANVPPPYTKHLTEIDTVVESYDDSAVHHT